MKKIFYIDPQSYNNLAVYDSSLLSNVTGAELSYFCNVNYQCSEIKGVKTYKAFSYSNKKSALGKVFSYSKSMMFVLGKAISQRPDIVHVQWIRLWLLDLIITYILRMFRIKVVHTAHNILPHVAHRFDKQKFAAYYKAVDKIIVHSERTKKEMIAIFGMPEDKVEVIYHGMIDTRLPETEVAECEERLRREMGIKPGDIVFGSLGLQEHYKGTELIIEAWKNSKKLSSSQNFHLIFAGKNRNIDFSSIAQYDNVHIHDAKLPDVDFEAYIRICSVILLPYLKISQSGVLFSALCCNIPVVVSNVGGLPEPLDHANVGWNIGEPNAKSLQTMMESLADKADIIERMKDDTLEFDKVKQVYSWETIGRNTSALYSKL